ncbi:uncharacterized protein LOC128551805, partial [Mercenaria mercenaria]|uniref:uncharacterized protein LOC128551805 n=1 Tax=Mercenaria mercenaria TaxID=6596 RepID=UPI00234F147D
PALQDDQKRWLIIGICLHSIIVPALRKYVPPILRTLYASLKTSDSIDSQTFRNYLRHYRPTHKELNYEAINGNGTVPKVKGTIDLQKYDFGVQNCVDLSKLFLQTHMAHYTGFDDTCDTSALLALIINIDMFPQALRTASEAVRDDVRNLWAHCNFNEWDNPRYQNSFLLMEHLIQCMKLQKQEEVDVLKLLATWKANGSALLQGTIGFEVLTEVKKATSILAEYCKITGATADENFENIYRVLTNVCSNLECLKQIVYTMETDRKKYWEKLKSLQQKVDSLSSKEDSSNEIHHFHTPDRIKTFVGREKELEQINLKFRANDERTYTQAICGLGGMGKTTLAIEYAWKFRENYPSGVFWVLVENDDTLLRSFQYLTVRLGIDSADGKDAMRKTMHKLSCCKTRLLLVVDNLDSDTITEHMAELLSSVWRRDTKIHVIITSRREKVSAVEMFDTDYCVGMNKLTLAQGRDFMKTRTGINTNDNTIEKFVEELGGLPLALEQAAAHIKVLQCSFKDYLDEFRGKRLKLRQAKRKGGHFHESEERLTVHTTWKMNIDQIIKHSEEEGLGTAAATVMEIIAIAPLPEFPLSLLNTGEPDILTVDGRNVDNAQTILKDLHSAMNSKLKKKQAVEILTRFSVVDREQSDELTMHRLVKKTIEETMDDEKVTMLKRCAYGMTGKARKNKEECVDATKPSDLLKIRIKEAINIQVINGILAIEIKTTESIQAIANFNS